MKKMSRIIIAIMSTVIVILIILVMLPAYKTDQFPPDHFKLSEGRLSLFEIAFLQEKHYEKYSSYAGSLKDLGVVSAYSEEKNWSLVLKDVSKDNYTITAHAGGLTDYSNQDCPKLSLSSDGTRSPKECWN